MFCACAKLQQKTKQFQDEASLKCSNTAVKIQPLQIRVCSQQEFPQMTDLSQPWLCRDTGLAGCAAEKVISARCDGQDKTITKTWALAMFKPPCAHLAAAPVLKCASEKVPTF